MPRSRILSFDDAFKKLSDASKVSSRRGYVKPHEQGRVDEALSLLVNGSTGISLGTKARSFYLDFLRDVENTCGIRMVILCAFGLGKATIASLAEGVRLRLPPEIRKRLDDLDNEVLQVLAKGYPAKFISNSKGPFSETQETQQNESAAPRNVNNSADHHSSLQLKLSSLLKFIDDQSLGDQVLQMVCPLSGVPLPYVEIKTESGFYVKIEFSLRSSEALIRHILAANEPLH